MGPLVQPLGNRIQIIDGVRRQSIKNKFNNRTNDNCNKELGRALQFHILCLDS